jgi:hypothetical protein
MAHRQRNLTLPSLLSWAHYTALHISRRRYLAVNLIAAAVKLSSASIPLPLPLLNQLPQRFRRQIRILEQSPLVLIVHHVLIQVLHQRRLLSATTAILLLFVPLLLQFSEEFDVVFADFEAVLDVLDVFE